MTKFTPEEKVEIYEHIFRRLNASIQTFHSPRYESIIRLIQGWDFAGRSGNGQYSAEEIQHNIDNVLQEMKDFK